VIYFKSAIPEKIQALDDRIKALEAWKEEVDTALDEIIGRIESCEKLARKGSLSNEARAKDQNEEEQGMEGYKPWSQRKQNRINQHRDPQFLTKRLRRSQQQ
jgi:hypothetical protein